MLSLKEFKEVEIKNDFSKKITGGQCTGGGGMITSVEYRTISLPDGTIYVQSRNYYKDWTSDESGANGTTYYGVTYSIGQWY